MIYVTAGFRGDYEKYKAVLSKIDMEKEEITDFRNTEKAKSLFVLGNILGKGLDGIKILQDMSMRSDIYPILGKHEYYAKTIFPALIDSTTIEQCTSDLGAENLDMFKEWLKAGGTATITAFLELSRDKKEEILDFLEDMAPYDEFEVGGKNFVLVNSSIDDFEIEKDLDEYSDEDFVLGDLDFSQPYFKNKFLISAGKATYKISEKLRGRIYAKKGHLAIYLGKAQKTPIICLDTLKTSFVD